jgi:hypothetical protein
MDKKILCLIVLISLICSSRGAAGDPTACTPPGIDGVQRCADNGSGSPTTGAANCAAGYSFTASQAGLITGSCTICPVNTY